MNSLTTAQTAAGQVPLGQATWRGLGLYFFLLAVQTTGATLIFLQGMPIYRQIVRDFANHQSRPGVLWWAVAAVLLIQIGYWARVRLRPPLPRRSHILIGHLAYFVARLSFIFASSAFAAMFFVRFDQLYLPSPRILALVLLLFSMFCWTLELERLARALQGTEGNL